MLQQSDATAFSIAYPQPTTLFKPYEMANASYNEIASKFRFCGYYEDGVTDPDVFPGNLINACIYYTFKPEGNAWQYQLIANQDDVTNYNGNIYLLESEYYYYN